MLLRSVTMTSRRAEASPARAVLRRRAARRVADAAGKGEQPDATAVRQNPVAREGGRTRMADRERIDAALPTLRQLAAHSARVVVVSHQLCSATSLSAIASDMPAQSFMPML